MRPAGCDHRPRLRLMSNPFFLASAPVECIEQAIQTSLDFGGEYSAGDAADKLNRDILDPANETWKAAWKGKTSQAYRMLKRANPNEKIIAVAIAGGPACDWERRELRNNFCQQYPDMVLKQIGDYDDFLAWLERIYPAHVERGLLARVPAGLSPAELNHKEIKDEARAIQRQTRQSRTEILRPSLPTTPAAQSSWRLAYLYVRQPSIIPGGLPMLIVSMSVLLKSLPTRMTSRLQKLMLSSPPYTGLRNHFVQYSMLVLSLCGHWACGHWAQLH